MTKDDNADVNISKDFYYAPVGNAGHVSVIDFENPASGEQSKSAFEGAVSKDSTRYRQFLETTISHKSDEDPGVTAITFVMHGIRDWGNWTNDFSVIRAGKEAALVSVRWPFAFVESDDDLLRRKISTELDIDVVTVSDFDAPVLTVDPATLSELSGRKWTKKVPYKCAYLNDI